MCTYVYVCMTMHVCIHRYMHTCICICMRIRVYTRMFECVCLYMYVRMYVGMHAACMCVYISHPLPLKSIWILRGEGCTKEADVENCDTAVRHRLRDFQDFKCFLRMRVLRAYHALAFFRCLSCLSAGLKLEASTVVDVPGWY